MGEDKRSFSKAAAAALCAVLLAVTGALAYFAASSGMLRNLFSLGEIRNEVLVEVVDRAPGDGSATFTRISWNSNQLTVTDDDGKATAVPVYSGNFASKGDIGPTEGVAGMGLAPDAYMYLPDTYSADELKAMFEGRDITFAAPNGGLNRTGTWNVGSIEPAANPDPQVSGGTTYIKYVLKLGWPVERFDKADLESVPDMLRVPERASYSFIKWTDCELVDGSFAYDGATCELYRTHSTWIAAADDAEVRVMWCTGDVLGSNATFTRVTFGVGRIDIVDAEGNVQSFDIGNIGNDGTTDSPDAFAYLPASWTEEYAQSLLNGARATFINLVMPTDPGYVVNVYKVLPEDTFGNYVKYKIRLTNWPETTIKESQLGRLDKVAPLVPTRDGYRFSGWSEATLIGDGLYLTVAQWEKLADDDPNNMALPAYAALYGDTLVFGRGDTVPADYQGLPLVESWRGIEEGRYDVDSVPWTAYKGAIENVAMRAKIRPVSTANWFSWCVNLVSVDLGKLDTVMTDDATDMFRGSTALQVLDLSSFDTQSMAKVDGMFAGCSSLARILVSTAWTNAPMASSTGMFAGCVALVGGNGYRYTDASTDAAVAVIDTDVNFGYLTQAADAAYAAVYEGGAMVFGRGSEIPSSYGDSELLEGFRGIEVASYTADTQPWRRYVADIERVRFIAEIHPASTAYWFNSMAKLSSLSGLGLLDLSETVDGQYMFGYCRSLDGRFDMGAFDTHNMVYWAGMFHGCTSLTEVTFGTDAHQFDSCEGIGNLFNGCTNLEAVTFPEGADFTKLQRMNFTFADCPSLEVLDLTMFETPSLVRINNCFMNCTSLRTVYASEGFSVANVTEEASQVNVFSGATVLRGGLGTSGASASYVYARVDAVGSPGAFTLARASEPHLWVAVYGDGMAEISYATAPPRKGGAALVRIADFDYFRTGADTYGTSVIRNCWGVFTVSDFRSFMSSVTSISCHPSAEGVVVDNLRCLLSWGSYFSNLRSVDLSALVIGSDLTGLDRLAVGCKALEHLALPQMSSDAVANAKGLAPTGAIVSGCAALESLDLSHWSGEASARQLVADCGSLTTILASDGFRVTGTDASVPLFGDCPALVGGCGTTYADFEGAYGSAVDDEDRAEANAQFGQVDREGSPGLLTLAGDAPDVPDVPEDPEDPIGALMGGMTLHEKVCQMFCVYPENLTADSGGSSLTAMGSTQAATLEAYPFGGVCLFGANIVTESQTKALTDGLQAASALPMLVAVDEEGGRVQRIGGTTYDGTKRGAGIGFQLDAMQTYEALGEATARGNAKKLADNCKRVGCNWDFAPVADVNSNPSNPIIGMRAYSSDYGVASDLISAAIEGFHEEGVLTSIKHFPGHGDTSTDSHVGAARVDKDLETLLAEDLVPFKAGIEAGADSVMIGHLMVPELDADNVATVSPYILQDVLRGQLGFDGVIVTDGMQMGALTNVYGKTKQGYIDAVLACLDAGVDVFLLPGYPAASADAIEAKVASGEISEERIDESCRRILEMKASIGLLDEALAERGLS